MTGPQVYLNMLFKQVYIVILHHVPLFGLQH